MKWTGIVLIALLDSCVAQRWKTVGCENFNKDLITEAVSQAITLAGSAVDVLNNNFNDPKVQSMVKYILGDDADLQTNVDKMKERFAKLQKYEKQESREPSSNFNRNTDLLIFCDESNYETTNGRLFNKAQGLPPLKAEAEFVKKCFHSKDRSKTPMAQTFSPFEYTPDYRIIHDAWAKQAKKLGKNGPPEPNPAGHFVENVDKPTTMDLCTWFLTSLNSGRERTFFILNDVSIGKVQDPKFLAELNNPALATPPGSPESGSGSSSGSESGSGSSSGSESGSEKGINPIDVLAGECLSGLLLHELTHTVLVGRALDSNDGPGGCYGWECVGELKDVNNADSIAIFGICMDLFKRGLWVDNDGNVLKV